MVKKKTIQNILQCLISTLKLYIKYCSIMEDMLWINYTMYFYIGNTTPSRKKDQNKDIFKNKFEFLNITGCPFYK
jgi:predicted ATP-grasp superfamily ATP-dependent carboligase